MDNCPHCGGRVTPSRQEETQRFSGRSFVVTLAASTCRKCGARVVASSSLERAVLEIACALALQGPVTGESFRFVRKALAFSAVTVAGLLDVTPETISRWENGQRRLDRTAWLTLGTLALERAGRPTDTMQRLELLRAAAPRNYAPVRIDASRAGSVRRTRRA